MIFLTLRAYRELVERAARADEMKLEVDRLRTVVLTMKREGFTVAPEALDEPWPGGKYVMDEPDPVTLEAAMAATQELDAADHDMIEKALLSAGTPE